MASIGTAIRLNDMMSAPLRQINRAMDGLLIRCESLDDVSSDGFTQMVHGQQEFNREVQEGSNALDGLTGKIVGAVSAFAGMQGIQKLANLSDSFTQTMSRLEMIVGTEAEAEKLFDKIAASADRSRASISATADTVAKLSLNAGAAFDSTDETILFAETLNKLFAIAGTEQASIASASLQLTQALGSGVLRGEEFNAVFEAAPNIMQTVADYMNVPIGQLRQMAQDGQITANVVKNALLDMSNEIDEQFQDMPMTWAQVWTGIMNDLYMASLPLLEVINLLANNMAIITPLVLGLAGAFAVFQIAAHWTQIATAVTTAYHAVVNFLTIGFGMLRGSTAAASAATFTYNSALLASPITWWVMAILAGVGILYALIAVINKVTGSTYSATGIIAGLVYSLFSFLWNIVASFVNFFVNVWTDPIGSIARLFADLADSILGMLELIASGIDKVFGSNLASAVAGWRSGLSGLVTEKYGAGIEVMPKMDAMESFSKGYDFGTNIGSSVSSFFDGGLGGLADKYSMEDLTSGIGDIPTFDEIATNTGDTAKSLEVTSEHLKYLRDIAEQEVINRFTTAEIRVEMGGVTNNVNSNVDVDGVIDYMVTGAQEAMERLAEGVHN